MARDPNEQRWEYVQGPKFAWGGMLTEGNPGDNPPNRPRLVVNMLLRNGEFVDRPGLSKIWPAGIDDSAAFDGCPVLIADLQLGTPIKLWIIGDGCPGVSAGVGFYLGHLDQEQSPEFQRAVYYSAAAAVVALASYAGKMYVGVAADFRQLQLIARPYGQEALSTSGTSQDTPLLSFPGFTIRVMRKTPDGLLALGLDAGAGASKVAIWDGKSLFPDDKTGIDPPTAMGEYHVVGGGDALVVGFAAASNKIMLRAAGASPGTWTTITPAAGTVASNDMVQWRGKLWIADGAANIWSLDEGTLSVAHTIVGAVINTVTVFNDLLYFGYDITASSFTLVGKYDGVTWTDAEKSITASFPTALSTRRLRGYRGLLIAGGTTAAAGGRLWISPGTDTAGAWTELTPSASFNGDVRELLVA